MPPYESSSSEVGKNQITGYLDAKDTAPQRLLPRRSQQALLIWECGVVFVLSLDAPPLFSFARGATRFRHRRQLQSASCSESLFRVWKPIAGQGFCLLSRDVSICMPAFIEPTPRRVMKLTRPQILLCSFWFSLFCEITLGGQAPLEPSQMPPADLSTLFGAAPRR